MKKIVFTIHSMHSFGGAEKVLSILTNALVNYYDITIITISGYDLSYKLDNRIKLITLDMHQESNNSVDAIKFNIKRILKLKKHLKLIDPDIVIGFTITVNIISIVAARLLGIPVVVSERSNPWKIKIPQIWRKIGRYVFPLANGIVVQTERTKDFYREYGVPLTKIYNPLIVDSQYKRVIQKNRNKVILAVGRLSEIKQFDLLIHCFNKVTNREGWRLVILGEGKERKSLENIVRELNLIDKVVFQGNVSNVDEYMKNSSIFTLTSKHEGFPNVLSEAMMYGMAVVSFNCETGPSEIIDSGINGILLENGDKTGLANCLEKLIENEDFRDALAIEGTKVTERLNRDKIVSEWRILINNIILKESK